jgi:hypothetical protein
VRGLGFASQDIVERSMRQARAMGEMIANTPIYENTPKKRP